MPRIAPRPAAALAELHEAGRGFALTRANALGPAGWRELADATHARADAVERSLGELIGGALAELERGWPARPARRA